MPRHPVTECLSALTFYTRYVILYYYDQLLSLTVCSSPLSLSRLPLSTYLFYAAALFNEPCFWQRYYYCCCCCFHCYWWQCECSFASKFYSPTRRTMSQPPSRHQQQPSLRRHYLHCPRLRRRCASRMRRRSTCEKQKCIYVADI